MIEQNYMAEYLNRIQSSPVNLKRSDSSSGKSSDLFKNILDNSMSRKREDLSAASRPEKQNNTSEIQAGSVSKGSKVKAYREIESANPVKVQQAQSDKSQIPEKKTESTEKTKHDVKAEVVIDSLSGALGIKPGELEQLLKSLNINAQDLSEPAKVGQAVDKLAKLLGLDENQKNALASTILEINKQAAKLIGSGDQMFQLKDDPKQNSDNNRKDWVKLDGIKLDVIDVSKASDTTDAAQVKAEMTAVVSQLKAKIGAIADNLSKGQESFIAEIADLVSSSFSKLNPYEDASAGGKVQGAENDANTAVKPADESILAEGKQISKDSSNEEKGSNKNADKGQEELHTFISKGEAKDELKLRTASKPVDSANNELLQSADNIAVNLANKSGNVYDVLKAEKAAQTANKSEIFNQVVEKAKVLLDGNKSEMVMNLKPDSLGKLSLKIVTERGIVAAQFVAESQQVKEVLETNMQLLKDTLEKQGLSIQGFSVSVGQDKSREFAQGRFNDGRSGIKGSKSNSSGNSSIITSSISTGTQRVNPYQWADSSINLTA